MNCAARLWLLQTPNAPKSLEFLIKGIANAFTLSRELVARKTLSESLENWQISELDRGRGLMSYGQRLGDRSQGR
jgi:hypothetical protein